MNQLIIIPIPERKCIVVEGIRYCEQGTMTVVSFLGVLLLVAIVLGILLSVGFIIITWLNGNDSLAEVVAGWLDWIKTKRIFKERN